MEVIKKGNVQEVKRLLEEESINPNYRGHGLLGTTPLYEAAFLGHTQIAQILLRHGANLNLKTVDGHTPLSGAVLGRHPQIVKLFIEHGIDHPVERELSTAVMDGNPEIVKSLLTLGADPNVISADGYNILIIPMMLPATTNTIQLVALLLEHGALICDLKKGAHNKRDYFTTAATEEVLSQLPMIEFRVMELLLEYGAQLTGLKGPYKVLELAGEFGTPCTHTMPSTPTLPFLVGQNQVARILEINNLHVAFSENELCKALYRAAINGNLILFSFILRQVNLNAKIIQGAFLAACSRGQIEILRFLSQVVDLRQYLTDNIISQGLLRVSVRGHVEATEFILNLGYSSFVLDTKASGKRVTYLLQNYALSQKQRKSYETIRALLVCYQHARRLNRILTQAIPDQESQDLNLSHLPREIHQIILDLVRPHLIEQAAIDYTFLTTAEPTSTQIHSASLEALELALFKACKANKISIISSILTQDSSHPLRISQAYIRGLIALLKQQPNDNNRQLIKLLSGCIV